MALLSRFPTWLLLLLCLWTTTFQNELSVVEAWHNSPLPRVKSRLRSTNRNKVSLQALPPDQQNQVPDRRSAMTIIGTAALTGFLLDPTKNTAALAYDKTFPVELDIVDADLKTPRQRAVEKEQQFQAAAKSRVTTWDPVDAGLGSLLWGGVLWLWTGSRSNPLATPLANVLYSQDDEPWLQDRNDGLFAALPAPLLALLAAVFGLLGWGVHRVVLALTEGSVALSFQLAVVLLIGGGALEIGRLASGEKKLTRDDFDRATRLEQEFDDFAAKRLRRGGYCHRNDVVQAFRRFYAKYRQADSTEYPLNDLEIERLLREWNQRKVGAQRSAAGFYTGLQINTEADVFVKR